MSNEMLNLCAAERALWVICLCANTHWVSIAAGLGAAAVWAARSYLQRKGMK